MSRGGNRPGAGRPAGSQNADTAAMQAALSGLLEKQVALGSPHGPQRPPTTARPGTLWALRNVAAVRPNSDVLARASTVQAQNT
jgi:hypothetical protein